jgi:hypothetical protein
MPVLGILYSEPFCKTLKGEKENHPQQKPLGKLSSRMAGAAKAVAQ